MTEIDLTEMAIDRFTEWLDQHPEPDGDNPVAEPAATKRKREKYRAELEQHIAETGGHAAEGLAAAFDAYVNGKEAEQEKPEDERNVA